MASNSTKGCRRLQRECAPNVSKSTIWNVLNKSPNLRHMRMTSAPSLKPEHCQARAIFADNHQTWTHEWDSVFLVAFFAVSSCFRLSGLMRKVFTRRPRRFWILLARSP